MKFVASLPFLAALANAVAIDLGKRESPLDVKIDVVGNSEVKATITNTGGEALRVFKTGSILDSRPIEKAEVFQGADKVAFAGMRVFIDRSALEEDSFQSIAAGETVEVQWDVAEVHDLSAGGAFDIASSGVLSYAEEDSTEIIGQVAYGSNVMTAQVDGEAAEKVRRDFSERHKRTAVQSDCSASQASSIASSLPRCRTYALNAATAATSGSAAKMTEYFKSSTSATRSLVAGVFQRVATECGSSTGGVSRTYCSDRLSSCSGGVVAYTVPSSSYIVFCSSWFGYPASTGTCHAADRPYIQLHETTHLSQIRGTSDYSCYGYDCVRGLSATQNQNHADTYAQFANAIAVGC